MSKNQVVLIDEVLTADSSRFWPADSYQVGMSPPSYDKQYVRDYLETLDWDKTPPAPKLPAEVIAQDFGKISRSAGAPDREESFHDRHRDGIRPPTGRP